MCRLVCVFVVRKHEGLVFSPVGTFVSSLYKYISEIKVNNNHLKFIKSSPNAGFVVSFKLANPLCKVKCSTKPLCSHFQTCVHTSEFRVINTYLYVNNIVKVIIAALSMYINVLTFSM